MYYATADWKDDLKRRARRVRFAMPLVTAVHRYESFKAAAGCPEDDRPPFPCTASPTTRTRRGSTRKSASSS